MKRIYKMIIILSLMLLAGITLNKPAVSQEEVPYEPATKIDFIITPKCSYDSSTGFFEYEYKLYSKPTSLQNIMDFDIETEVICEDLRSPSGWNCLYMKNLPTVTSPIVSWVAEEEPLNIRPSNATGGFSFRSRGVPGIATSYSQGYVPHRWYPEGMAITREDDLKSWPKDSVKSKTIGPVQPPPEPVDGVSFIDRIISLKHQAFQLGWITNAGIKNSLDQKLDNAKKKLQQKMNNAAKNILGAFINELEAQRGKHLDDNAFYLLKVNAEFLISKI